MDDHHAAVQTAATFPVLAPIMERHVEELGELLPTLFMGEVAEWAADRYATDPELVGDLTNWLQVRFQRGGPDVQDMIGVGFVEMLPEGHAGDGGIVDSLAGPLRRVAVDLGTLGEGQR